MSQKKSEETMGWRQGSSATELEHKALSSNPSTAINK
jgi:hypothetical protein